MPLPRFISRSLVLISLVTASVQAGEVFEIYPGTIPGGKTELPVATTELLSNAVFRDITRPTLEVFVPEAANNSGTAVVILPGGGYESLAYQLEGVPAANEFARHGVTAFVLNYRLPDDDLMESKHLAPLQDAQQALIVVAERAGEWGISPQQIGIMGFSAGGHLASTVATRYDSPEVEVSTGLSVKPAFQILIYPVISMQTELTHAGSRDHLLGLSPSKAMVDMFSSELQVTAEDPPAWITHAGDDDAVDVDNSILYYEALRHIGVPAEMHLYAEGGHGFVLGKPTDEWMAPLMLWMQKSGWL